jgi:regulator of sigma E protease
MFLAIIWSQVGMVVAKLLLSLSILVVLHEFGHYITARWFGCRVEKFFLFFDPWFAIFKKKIGDTVYGIGWLPLGGYVKISGMIDESMDKEQLALPPQPWEFRSKPAWQRLIIMLGGVTMNVLVAFIIYAGILMVWGEKKTFNNSLKYGIQVNDSLMAAQGFHNGDKIVAVDGKPVVYYEDIMKKVLLANTVTLDRGGKEITLTLPPDFIGQLVEHVRNKVPLISVRIPVYVREVPDTSTAFKAGLKPGDQIVGIDSMPSRFYDELTGLLNERKGKSVQVNVLRKGQPVSFSAPVSDEGKLGFMILGDDASLDSMGIQKSEEKKYSFFQAVPAGIRMAGDQLGFYIDQFKKILSPKTGAYKGVGGFKSMANVFPSEVWDWESFWKITAFFSIILAFMNLLPIPALDGGHVMFTLYEMITGRKPGTKFMEYAQIVGMVLLLALMLYANLNDIFGYGRGR